MDGVLPQVLVSAVTPHPLKNLAQVDIALLAILNFEKNNLLKNNFINVKIQILLYILWEFKN